MNIPVLVLLGFAAWTLTILSVGVGAYRWSLLPSGRRVGDEGAGGQMRRLRFRGERRRAGLELEPRKTSGEGRGGFPLRRESRPRLHRPPRGRREIVGAAGGASTNHCRRGGAHCEHADQLDGKQREANAHDGIGLAQRDVN